MSNLAKKEQQAQSLSNALNNQSFSNYPAIFEGFLAKGIDIDDIKPRTNIFTFNAWKALGFSVKKGEHGVKVVTAVKTARKDAEGNDKPSSFIRSVTVFHSSQVQPIESDKE